MRTNRIPRFSKISVPFILLLFERVLRLLAAFTVIVPTLLSCSGPRGREITVAVGGAPAELDFWQGLIEEFEAGTAIRVNLLRQPTDTDQRRQGLVIPLEAKMDRPDVLLMDVIWLAQFAASGWLAPLDGYVRDRDRTDGVELDRFFSNVIAAADRWRGELIALPVYVDGGVLYYRKDLLEKIGMNEPPEDWDQLVSCSLRVQERIRPANPRFFGFVWQGAQYEGLTCNFLEFAASNGGGILSKDGKISIRTPENLEAARFMVDLIRRWRISPPNTYIEMREEESRISFQEGDALFERNWPYALLLHEGADSPVRGKIGIAPLPGFTGHKSVSTLGGWHIGISKFSGCKDLAWEFVRFVVSKETQKQLAMKLGWPPGRRDLYDDPRVRADLPHFARLASIFESARPRPALPYYTQLSEVLQRYLNAMLAGLLTPEAALDSSERDAQKIVDRYGKE